MSRPEEVEFVTDQKAKYQHPYDAYTKLYRVTIVGGSSR